MSTEPAAAEPVCKFDQGCHRVVPCEPGCGALAVPVPSPTDRAVLRDRIAGALYESCMTEAEAVEPMVDAVLAVLPAPTDRAAVLREAADRLADEIMRGARFSHEDARQPGLAEAVELLRRLAAEAPTTTKPETDEDPARIDRLRPEFTEHSSVEAIDAQLRRSRAQERRWHIRTEWLIGLRDTRIGQKARGEWPAAGVRQDGAQPQGWYRTGAVDQHDDYRTEEPQ